MVMMMIWSDQKPWGASEKSRPAAAPRIGLHPSVSLRCAAVHLPAHNKENPTIAAVPSESNAVQH
eukprot:1288302-Pyramimonas_sp.AAC.1